MSVALQTSQPPSSMRPFLIIWIGQAYSWFGSELVQFALIWWLTKSTGSATVLAFATTVAVLPRIFVGPFAGALVDRWDRRVVMLVADAAIALATLVLAVLYRVEIVEVWHIYGLMFVRAVGGVFHLPAITASTTLLIPEKHLARIGGLNQTLAGVVAIVSPPLRLATAGPIADALGAPVWYVIAGVSHATLGLLALCIPALMHIESKYEM